MSSEYVVNAPGGGLMTALVDRPLEEWAFSRALFRQDSFKSDAREKKEKRKISTIVTIVTIPSIAKKGLALRIHVFRTSKLVCTLGLLDDADQQRSSCSDLTY